MKISEFIKLLFTVFVVGGVLTANIATSASDIPGYPDRVDAYDAREVAMLPPYCKHTNLFRENVPGGNNAAEIKRWRETLGGAYITMHHYCWGLMKTNRAVILARTQQAKTFYLRSAIMEFDYVIYRAPADFVLLPEILTKKAENLIRLGSGPFAVKELERAIEIKADYWPPYATLSDYYKATGDNTKARESLEKGLSSVPEATGLKRRLIELEGGTAKPKSQPRATSDPK